MLIRRLSGQPAPGSEFFFPDMHPSNYKATSELLSLRGICLCSQYNMKKFIYKAKDLSGKKVTGTIVAEDVEAMRDNLTKNNLYLSSFRQISNKKPSS